MRRILAAALVAGLMVAGMTGPSGRADASRSGPSSSSGSKISTDDGAHRITYTAGPGQANNPTVSVDTPTGTDQWIYTVHDVAPITPGAGCTLPDLGDPATVACVLHEGGDFYVNLHFNLGDGVDRIDFAAADAAPRGLGGYAVIHGGTGNDVLVSSGAEYLYGDDGNDTLVNGLIRGGNGNDTIVNADDGLGEAGNDIILGTDDPTRGDRLLGGPGNDMISGGAGPDIIHGNSGKDRIVGGTGNDTLYGGPGTDTVYGNSGTDHLEGGPDQDMLSGGPGADFVKP